MSKIGPVSTSIPETVGVLVSLDEIVEPIKVDSGVRDTGFTPTTTLRGGLVLSKNAAGTKYIRADDAAAPGGSPAEVKALEAANADWQNRTLSFKVNHGLTVSVTLGGADDTNAEVIAALNADPDFASELFADEDGGLLRVRTIRGGPLTHILATDNEDNSAFGANGLEGQGSFPKFAVLKHGIDMLEDGAAADQDALGIVQRGRFKKADLIGLTALAEAALRGEGCLFE